MAEKAEEIDFLTAQLKDEAENKRIAEIIVESELALLARYIVLEIPGEPSVSEGAGHTAIRIMKTYRTVIRAMAAQLVELSGAWGEEVLLLNELLDGPLKPLSEGEEEE